MKKNEIISIYLGEDRTQWPLPPEICYIILEIAGLCQVSKKWSFFYVHCPRLIKNRHKIKRRS